MTQSKFRELFWNADIMYLKNCGVPKDEYDSEADIAFEIINKEDSLLVIQLKLLSIFHIWFKPSDPCVSEIYNNDPEFHLLNNEIDINQAVKNFDNENRITNLANNILS